MIRRIRPRSEDGKLKFIQELVSKKNENSVQSRQEPTIEKAVESKPAPSSPEATQTNQIPQEPTISPQQQQGVQANGTPAPQTSGQVNTPAPESGDMWEIAASEDKQQTNTAPSSPAAATPAAGATDERPVRRGGRVKTRLLGFERSSGNVEDVLGNSNPEPAAPAPSAKVKDDRYPVGWVIVLKGPGRGESTSLQAGVSQIGRGEDQAIQLDFGDNSISRENHATIAYDDEQRKFFIGHGGKSNLVRLNEKPVLSTEDLYHGDLIRIGQTTLLFLALCGENFSWSDEEENPETIDE